MLSIALKILMFASFVSLMVLVWRVSKRSGWRIRAVIYGWGASILWAFLWSFLLPMWLKDVLDPRTLNDTFPDGTWTAGFLVCGWFWPLILVVINQNIERKKQVSNRGV